MSLHLAPNYSSRIVHDSLEVVYFATLHKHFSSNACFIKFNAKASHTSSCGLLDSYSINTLTQIKVGILITQWSKYLPINIGGVSISSYINHPWSLLSSSTMAWTSLNMTMIFVSSCQFIFLLCFSCTLQPIIVVFHLHYSFFLDCMRLSSISPQKKYDF